MFESGHGDGEPLSEINVTPLVDVMLVLLVIFIVTASAATTTVRVDLPRTARASPPAAGHPVRLSVDRDGQYRLDGERVGLAKLERRLVEIHRRNPSRTARLAADRRVAYGQVGKAMAALEHAGIRKITILSNPR